MKAAIMEAPGRPWVACRRCGKLSRRSGAVPHACCRPCNALRSIRRERPCLGCGVPTNAKAGSCQRCMDRKRREAAAPEGVADFCGPAPLPEPTAHLPGTAEKEAVLMRRASLGQQLHHPEDARRDAR